MRQIRLRSWATRRDYGDLMEASATFITHMRQFLSASRQRVVSEIDQLEGAGEFIAAQESITKHLDELNELVRKVSGGGM